MIFILHPQAEGYGDRYAMLGRATFPMALYFIIAMSLMTFGRMLDLWRALINSSRMHRWRSPMILQLLSYGLFIFSAAHLMPTNFNSAIIPDAERRLPWELLLFFSALSTIIFSLVMIAPKSYWREFLAREKGALLIAFGFSSFCFGFGVFMQQSWDVLGEPTMQLSAMLLGLLYREDVILDLHDRLLGTSNFTAAIGYRCSGYEGIGMVIAFITWYLWHFGRYFRFPAILLVYPIGVTVIWLFNAFRIAALIAIGSSISPRVAVTGFHSNAGLISFVIVSLGIVWLTGRFRLFDRSREPLKIRIDSGNATLVPFLVMLGSTLLVSALSSDFQWFYPLRAIATGTVIFLLWKKYELDPTVPSILPIICGAAIFLLWITLIPASPQTDQSFAKTLFDMPALLAFFWILFRFLGSALIVPIAEELAFRAYLFDLLGIGSRAKGRQGAARFLAVFLISLAFGLLHEYVIAATLAGLVYGLLRLRSNRVWDAIVSHVTTNFLLSIYVFWSGHWSYWQ
jgi:exosortase E/protease (VPEID-CTERM system)